MKLSSDLLAEITESVTIVSHDQPREADRRSPRVRLSSQLMAFKWSDRSKPFAIRVQDLSEGGVGILHHERIALDEKLVVSFPRPRGQQVLVLGTVLYWEPLSEKLYAIGVGFDRVVDQAEFQSQAEESSEQGGVIARLTQVFSKKWRAAS